MRAMSWYHMMSSREYRTFVIRDRVIAKRPFGIDQHDVGAREQGDQGRDQRVRGKQRRTPIAFGDAGRDAPPGAIEVRTKRDVAAGAHANAIAGEYEEQRGRDHGAGCTLWPRVG